jgi:hypothetical protein
MTTQDMKGIGIEIASVGQEGVEGMKWHRQAGGDNCQKEEHDRVAIHSSYP